MGRSGGPERRQPALQDEIAQVLREITAAENLCESLPPGSRERTMVELAIAQLNAQLVRLLVRDEPLR